MHFNYTVGRLRYFKLFVSATQLCQMEQWSVTESFLKYTTRQTQKYRSMTDLFKQSRFHSKEPFITKRGRDIANKWREKLSK